MPPCASGPVLTVRSPSRNGSDCATAGAGKRASAAAAPAALPANMVRRLTLRVLGLADMTRPPITFLRAAATSDHCGKHFLSPGGAPLAGIIGEAGRPVKPAIVAFSSPPAG